MRVGWHRNCTRVYNLAALLMEPQGSENLKRNVMRTEPQGARGSRRRITFLLTSAFGLVGIVAWSTGSAAPTVAPSDEQLPTANTLAPIAAATVVPRPVQQIDSEAYLVAAREAGRSNIWAHVLGESVPYKLTSGEWDDRDPVVSPTLGNLAFSSNRDGNWELYLLDLADGALRRLTQTNGYEGNPTWSPDGRWLAFEAYYEGNLDIWILPIDATQAPIRLTDHPAADRSPAWDPGGRRIAFVSDRGGGADIFIADLDQPNDRFRNLTHSAQVAEADPAFSPDGAELAFGVIVDGVRGIQRLRLDDDGQRPNWVGQGSQPVWSSWGQAISAIYQTPSGDHVVEYPLGEAISPARGTLVGSISKLHWSPLAFDLAATALDEQAAPLYETLLDQPRAEGERLALVPLNGIRPEGSVLSDLADEAFMALRQRVAGETGWDVLGNLQHAFVGINDPLPPGYAYNDWLYTGRAFSLSSAAVQAGWLEIVREDFGQQTYWRVYVRTLAQDGSQGEPLRSRPWDFSVRFAGDPSFYDAGGAPKESIPEGYYVDFTTLAADYGFERLPALANWRSFYPGARFDEFALREGLDWVTAMAQLYPQSAIATPTPYQTPTPTPTNTPRPTPTPWWWRWRTPTPTAEATATATP